MSAFRKAVLSVDPERLEKFSNEMKKSIREKPKSKRKGTDEKGSKSKRRRKHSSHEREKRKSSSSDKTKSDKKTSDRKKTSFSRSKDRKYESGKSLKEKQSKKTKSKNPVDESDFDPKDLDLSIPLSPLSELVKERKELLDTIFSIIKGPKLTSMLPDILKLMPLEEIKKLCGEQLDVMSSKRILHTISGTEMVSSSGTDSSDNERNDEESPKIAVVPVPMKPDHSLQANFIDSTTSDQPSTGPSMLFPSAISTAQAAMTNHDSVKETCDDGTDHDTVSTSTEQNLIYTDQLSHKSSDTEEGEVNTSDEEREIVEHEDDMIVVHDVHEEENPDEEEDVFVVEELLDEDLHNKLEEEAAADSYQPFKNKRKVSVKKVQKETTSNDPDRTASKDSEVIEIIDSASPDIDDKPGEITTDQKEKTEQSGDPHAGKSQLEILELELRARAIRSLMKAAQSGKLKPNNK